jgi:hypothetical protein
MKGEFGTHNRSLNNCDFTQLEYLFPQTILIFNIIIFQYFQGISKVWASLIWPFEFGKQNEHLSLIIHEILTTALKVFILVNFSFQFY